MNTTETLAEASARMIAARDETLARMAAYNVPASDDCPSGTATAVRMGRSRRVHHLYSHFHAGSTLAHMPACGAGMGNPSAPIVPTDAEVTCPSCLKGDVL